MPGWGVRRASRAVAAAAALACAAALSGGVGACTDRSSSAAAADAGADAHAKDAGSDSGDAGIDDAEMPRTSPEELAARMRHLLEAMAQDNPDLASDVLFPREGYVATKDVADPQKAWEKKVQQGFRRSIERLHKRTKGVENAKFVSFELGHAITQVTPKKKDFKKPLWRVKHSKLTFTVDGKQRHLDVAEMIAWRGNWYVTRIR